MMGMEKWLWFSDDPVKIRIFLKQLGERQLKLLGREESELWSMGIVKGMFSEGEDYAALRNCSSLTPACRKMLLSVPALTSLWWGTTQVFRVVSFHQISCVPPVARLKPNPSFLSFLMTSR